MNEKKVKVLVIGTDHALQRHQDTMPDREELRAEFEQRPREILKERKVSLLAEEAGDDNDVWEHLKHEDELAQALGIDDLFGAGSKTVDAPVPTIAKKIADENPGNVRHVDVRPPNAADLTIEQRDEAMATKILQILKVGEEAIVIVGDSHREGVATRLKNAGLSVESIQFP
jgi:pheromone shutdown protein TraB